MVRVRPPLSSNGYRIEQQIAGGHDGVWRGTAPDGLPVAIKIFRRFQEDHRPLERVAHFRQQFNHPAILKILAVWSEPGHLYIATELADGSLHERMREFDAQTSPSIPVEELLHYLRQAAEGVDYLHSQNIPHGNVKPDHLLLCGNKVWVTGFGYHLAQTDPAVIMGTPAYIAPEQCRGGLTMRSDQYSLACTYVMLRLGRPPFRNSSIFQLLADHLEKMPDLEPLPQTEKNILLGALAKKPEERYSSCLEFVAALEKALGPPWCRPQERAFLANLQNRPGDEVTLLVYADWLDEQGDVRGQMLRLVVELAPLPIGDARFANLFQRLLELATPERRSWLRLSLPRHFLTLRHSLFPKSRSSE